MKKILIADDSATLRAILRFELEKNPDFLIFESRDGAETLQKIQELKPDLITLDVTMPDMDGYQVCSLIRNLENEAAKTPIIFITSSDTMASRQRGHRVGGNDFIVKPFVPAELHAAINKQLNRNISIEGARILIVDDSPFVRQILENYLSGEQIELLQASCGEEALEILRENLTSIDAVITDYHMPGLNGEDLCRAIRKDIGDLDLPVIFITSKRELANQLFNAGATDYLQKPFSREELLARVHIHIRPMLMKRFLYENLIDVKRLTRELEQKNEQLEIAQQTILKKTQEITSDLLVASEFQRRYLGQIEVPDYLKLSLYYQPMGFVSGDFYMVRTNHTRTCNVLIGDVAGHGVGPAFVSMIAKTLLDRDIDTESIGEMMSDLNANIEKTIPTDRYLTAVLLRIYENGRVNLANAGHPGIIVLPADGSPHFSIKPEGTPLGMFDNSIAFFDENQLQLKPGDKLILFTDGIFEQKNSKGEAYGMSRFEKSLVNCQQLSPDETVRLSMTAFGEFVGAADIDDDQTLLVIQYR